MRPTGWFSLFQARVVRRTCPTCWSKRGRLWPISAAAESLESRCLLAAGDLDPSFGVGGKVTTDFGAASAQSASVALQSDGKIVVAGTTFDSTFAFTVARYNTDGTLDTSFDSDGTLTTGFGDARGFATSVVVQTDGKIVVAGRIADSFSVDFGLVRYNEDGSLDTDFGIDGLVRTSFGTSQCRIENMALQSDGKIVVAGYLDTNNGTNNFDFALARYNTDGSLDSTFDGDGKLSTDFGATTDVAYSVAVQPNGKIVAAGFTSVGGNEDVALVRYNGDGTLDTSFDGDGKLTTDLGISSDRARGVVVQPDDKIVVVASSDEFVLARFNNDGTLDTSFDGDGVLMTDFGIPAATATSLALQTNGKLVVAGGSDAQFAVARYLTDGSLDASFGVSGKLLTDFGTADAIAKSVVVQADGKIVVVGLTFNNVGHGDFALARYLVTSDQPPTFTSANAISVPENTTAIQTVAATDPEHATLTYSLDGGADSALFAINATTGALSFKAARDFENSVDSDHNNVYLVTVKVSDGANDITHDVQVTVTNLDEFPAFTSADTASIPENTTAVLTVTANDPEDHFLLYGIAGGADQSRFSLDFFSGALSFVSAPDFEHPTDTNYDNVYEVQVAVSDGDHVVTQTVNVQVTNIAEPIVVTLPATGGSVTALIVGGQLHVGRSRTSPDLIAPVSLDHVSAVQLQGSNRSDRLTLDVSLNDFAGTVAFFGNAGNDSLNASAMTQAVVFSGGVGNDTFNGGSGNDSVDGGSGNDSLLGGSGNDSLLGGSGNDSINGGADQDRLKGDAGDDVLLGGTGNDRLSGGAGADTMLGQAGGDSLNGDSGNNVIDGGDGNDTLTGGDDNDSLRGGNGNDFLFGSKGNDLLLGSAGNDYLFGDAGTDTLLGESGNDILFGGSGTDTINPGSGRNTIADSSRVIDMSFAFDFDALLAAV